MNSSSAPKQSSPFFFSFQLDSTKPDSESIPVWSPVQAPLAISLQFLLLETFILFTLLLSFVSFALFLHFFYGVVHLILCHSLLRSHNSYIISWEYLNKHLFPIFKHRNINHCCCNNFCSIFYTKKEEGVIEKWRDANPLRPPSLPSSIKRIFVYSGWTCFLFSNSDTRSHHFSHKLLV